jgi:hypothetical protein
MRGVTILGIGSGTIRWARFYMEPVDVTALDIDGAVRAQLGGS